MGTQDTYRGMTFEVLLDRLVDAVESHDGVAQSGFIQMIWRMAVKLESCPAPHPSESSRRKALKAALLRAMADHWQEAPKLRMDECAPGWAFEIAPAKEFFNVNPVDALDPFDPEDWNPHFKALNLYAPTQFVFFV